MSDGMTATSEAAPTSTDLAAQVVESAEQTPDTTASETPATPEVDAPTPVESTAATETPAAPPTAAEVAAAAKFLQKQGHNPTNPRGGNTYLPYHTVEKMLDRYATEMLSEHQGKFSTLETEHKTLKQQWDEVNALGELMERDPRAFLEAVSQHDERYRAFLTPQEIAKVERAISDKPEPDIDLGNGAKSYSVEAIDRYIEWKAQQLLDQRLKPIEDRAKSEEQRATERRQIEQLDRRVNTQIDEAKAWPGWSDYEGAILETLQKDSAAAKAAGRRPTMTLREAYLEVKASRLQTDHDKVRDQVLAGLQTAPKSTATGRQTTETPAKTGQKSSADIVRAVVAQMEKAS